MRWEPVGQLAHLAGMFPGQERCSRFTATTIAGGVIVMGGEPLDGLAPDGSRLNSSDEFADVPDEATMTAGPVARKSRLVGSAGCSTSFEILEYVGDDATTLVHDGASDRHSSPFLDGSCPQDQICDLCGEPLFVPDGGVETSSCSSRGGSSSTENRDGGAGTDGGSGCGWLDPSLCTLRKCGHVVHTACIADTGAEGTGEARRCPTCSEELAPSCQPLPDRRTLPSDIPTEALLQNSSSYNGSRASHCACALNDGRVLVMGGIGSLAILPQNLANPPLRFDYRSCSTVLPSGFVCSFTDAAGFENDDCFVKSARGRDCSWSEPIAPMIQPRHLFAMDVLIVGEEGFAFLTGGWTMNSPASDGRYDFWTESEELATCELYDIKGDNWYGRVAPMPFKRSNHCGFTMADGRFVVIGGRVNRVYSESCSVYTFSVHGPFPEDPVKAAEVKEVLAGTRTTEDLSLTEEETDTFFTAGRWEDFPPLNHKRSNHAGCLVQKGSVGQESIVVTGGWKHEHTTELYDPQLRRWFDLPCRTAHPRRFHAMASIGKRTNMTVPSPKRAKFYRKLKKLSLESKN